MTSIRAGKRTIEITKPDKILFPEDGYTKVDLAEYYAAIAKWMVPHTRDRMMSLQRFPDGIGSESFFSKTTPKYFPDWIPRFRAPKKGGTVDYVVCNEAAALVYLAQQAVITPHVSLHKIDDLMHPDQMIFDLDPPEGRDFKLVRSVAHLMHDLLDELGLPSFVKTTGSKGLHIVVPLDGSASFEDVRSFAQDVAAVAIGRDPKHVTMEVRKVERKGRLLLDWMRNGFGATVVSAFGVRSRDGAPVSMPVDWAEIDERGFDARRYNIKNAVAKMEQGDPWKGWRRRARSLRKATGTLADLHGE